MTHKSSLVVALLLHKLDKLLVHLVEVLTLCVQVLLVLLAAVWNNHHHTGRALGSGRCTELGTGGDKHVGDSVVLAQDWKVGNDVHGGDIGGKNDNAVGDLGLSVRGGNGRLAESLDDFLDTTLERLVDGSWKAILLASMRRIESSIAHGWSCERAKKNFVFEIELGSSHNSSIQQRAHVMGI